MICDDRWDRRDAQVQKLTKEIKASFLIFWMKEDRFHCVTFTLNLCLSHSLFVFVCMKVR